VYSPPGPFSNYLFYFAVFGSRERYMISAMSESLVEHSSVLISCLSSAPSDPI
jgi:hypothetical protein